MSTALKVDKQGRLKVPEASIEQTCDDILILDGWTAWKMEFNFSEKKRRAFGQIGMPDKLYLRPLAGWMTEAPITDRALCERMWIEWKAKAGKVSAAQVLWHVNARKRGELTLIAGIDFPASIEEWQTWYKDSGLQRRHLK